MRQLTLITSLLILFVCTSLVVSRKPPAGTQPVPGMRNIFLDQVEVTNGTWRNYITALKAAHGAESSEVRNAYPDTAVWELAYHVGFWNDKRYNDYPVVGISFQQAQQYCEWRSRDVSAKEKRDITYSLPDLRIYQITQRGRNANKVAEGLYSTALGFRSFLGLCDNAAEMTAKEGQAVKGSERENCLETYEYYVPTPSLGFRCMAKL